MSNYNKATNFAVKDTLTSGDPDKVVSGAEIDNEFNSISSAIGSKIDKVSAATTNNLAALNANGNVIDSGFAGNSTVPAGGIIMWSGLISAIPTGWSLCDGTDGTPDLRNRFVVGAGDEYDRNDVGGEKSVQLTESELPSHNHTMESAGSHNHGGSTSVDGFHDHDLITGRNDSTSDHASGSRKGHVGNGYSARFNEGSSWIGGAGNHSHTINSDGDHTHTINNAGGDNAHENRPPYFALAYIMKL